MNRVNGFFGGGVFLVRNLFFNYGLNDFIFLFTNRLCSFFRRGHKRILGHRDFSKKLVGGYSWVEFFNNFSTNSCFFIMTLG